MNQVKGVNQRNQEIKSNSGLSPEDDKEVNRNRPPLTLTPEEIAKDDAFKDPEDDIADPEDPEDKGPRSIAENQKGPPPPSSPDTQVKSRSKAPTTVRRPGEEGLRFRGRRTRR